LVQSLKAQKYQLHGHLLPDKKELHTEIGDLSAQDLATKNLISIDPKVPLGPKSYLWEVKVPPGTYVIGLNDGAGQNNLVM
jgi:hypothetical protein